MYQQINLYQPIFRRQRHVFSALAMAQAAGVLVVALVAIYLYGLWQVLGLEAEVVQLEGREKAYAAQLARLDPTEAMERGKRLEEELKALNETLVRQQKLVEVLREQPLGSTGGFSGPLAALAQQHREGLWLTRLVLSGGSGEMQLVGASITPERIPEYLQDLGEEPALEGQRFDTLEIWREEGDAHVSFRASTRVLNQAAPRDAFARRSP